MNHSSFRTLLKLTAPTFFLAALAGMPACSSSSSGNNGGGATDSGTPSTTDSSTGTKDSGTSTTTDGSAVTDTGTTSTTGDSSEPVTDATGPEDSAIVDTGTIMGTEASTAGLAGTYQCMLSGTATTNLGTQMLPFDGTMVVTVSGSAITAVLTNDGGADCTVDFTATTATTATVNAGQTCMVPVTMPIATTATLSFVSPTGTASLSGNTITANMPFSVSAAGGVVTGTGTLTGPCTKM